MGEQKENTFYIKGGKILKGEVNLAGAKNVATKVIIASLLTEEKTILENIPFIGDVEIVLQMLNSLGVKSQWLDKNVLEIDPSGFKECRVPLEYSGKNRVPILLFGPLLHKFQEAQIPVVGGCSIGERPVDFHINGFKQLGAEIYFENNCYYAKAKELKGTTVELDYPSIGATENLLLGAVLAKGTTVIKNAAIEPEIEDLVTFLQSMGAIIYQDVNRTWIVEGVSKLKGTQFKIINDRVEAVSFACLSLANKGDIFIRGAEPKDLSTFLNWVRKIGGNFQIFKDGLRFFDNASFKGVALETDVHPGFMTDWQPPFSLVLTQAEGVSIIHETVYENRFGYVSSLNQMGAQIYLFTNCLGSKPCRFNHRDFPHSAIIVGPTSLRGGKLTVPDLRAGFSYVIAALISQGESEIQGIDKIERGYENIKERLKSIGAEIE